MKKIILALMFLVVGAYSMQNYRAVPMDKAILLQKGKDKKYCHVCGMTLPMFYRTNHAATNSKGEAIQYCSITCLVKDMTVNHKHLKNFKVVDNDTLKFIDSNKAYFVVGSKKPGTMSMVSKYAFASKKSAEKFAKENGGKIMTFGELLEMVKQRQKKELAMIAKKQKMMAQKGAVFYRKMCQKTDKKFNTVAEAKAFVVENNLCGNIRGKKLQIVGLYLVNRNK